MEALASSNMADMPLINLIGKSTGCLACCMTSAHPSDSLLKPSVSSVTGLSRCQNNFPSLEQNLAIGLQTRSPVLHNLLFSLRIHGFFPQLRSIMCVYVCGVILNHTIHLPSLQDITWLDQNTQTHAHTPICTPSILDKHDKHYVSIPNFCQTNLHKNYWLFPTGVSYQSRKEHSEQS